MDFEFYSSFRSIWNVVKQVGTTRKTRIKSSKFKLEEYILL